LINHAIENERERDVSVVGDDRNASFERVEVGHLLLFRLEVLPHEVAQHDGQTVLLGSGRESHGRRGRAARGFVQEAERQPRPSP
jgi:hypothetical protein